MTRPVELVPSALDELADAAAWYEAQRPGLGFEFVAEIERVLALIAERPEAFPVWKATDPSRRATAARFPYAIFFDVSRVACW